MRGDCSGLSRTHCAQVAVASALSYVLCVCKLWVRKMNEGRKGEEERGQARSFL